MKLIVCLDDKNGMLFNKRRQSSDRCVCERILEKVGAQTLWMNDYSARLFPQDAAQIKVSAEPSQQAKPGEYCFVENTGILPDADQVEEVTIYRWNRVYPSDVKFPSACFEKKWNLKYRLEFTGNSHDTITEEVYTL